MPANGRAGSNGGPGDDMVPVSVKVPTASLAAYDKIKVTTPSGQNGPFRIARLSTLYYRSLHLMNRFTLRVAAWAFACLPLQAADAGQQAAKKETGDTPEEKIIRDKSKAFLDAFNRGDVAALVAHYAKDAEIIHQDGGVTRGREAIQRELETFFAKNKGAKLELSCEAVRHITPE